MTYRDPNGPPPGAAGHWNPASGDLPNHAVNQLAEAGVDPTDPVAVNDFFTTGYYADAGNRPYWWWLWAEKMSTWIPDPEESGS